HPFVNAGDAAFLAKSADIERFYWSPDPFEFSRIKADSLYANELLENQAADPITYSQAVSFGLVVKIVCRYQAARTGHVLYYRCGRAWNMFTNVAGNSPRIRVKTASRRKPNNKTNRFTLIKILSPRESWQTHESQGLYPDGDSSLHRSLL